uniref:Armadillo repeat containing 7 n=1 Tax=Monodelphis domestica TaxID=13616 RepID=A0A5F8GXU8_MONDO
MDPKPRVVPEGGRLEYLQALVTEFQETASQEAKEQVLANLANFAYDPNNYQYLRELQVASATCAWIKSTKSIFYRWEVSNPSSIAFPAPMRRQSCQQSQHSCS